MLLEKLKMQTIEFLRCPNCYESYNNLKLKKCTNCHSELELVKKHKLPKITKILILVILIVLIILGISIYNVVVDNRYLQECYISIKENESWYGFQKIVNKHSWDFSKKAYDKLYQAMDEKIEEIKSGDYGATDEKVFKWTGQINSYTIDSRYKTIREKEALGEAYNTINIVDKLIEENNYKEAYKTLLSSRSKYKEYFQAQNIIIEKTKEIEDKAVEEIQKEIQPLIDNEQYSSAKNILLVYISRRKR